MNWDVSRGAQSRARNELDDAMADACRPGGSSGADPKSRDLL